MYAYTLTLLFCAALSQAQVSRSLDGARLVGLTTGSTAALSGELVAIDPLTGRTLAPVAIESEGGHGSPSDVVRARDGQRVLVAQIEFRPDGSTFSRLQHVDPRTGKVRTLVDVGPGALDCLAWERGGALLGTLAPSAGGNLELVELDPTSGATKARGTLDTFVRSLAFARGNATLFGLQTAGATWPDALVTLDPASGKRLSTVELHLPEAATALEVGPDGALLVTGAGHTLYELDPATGQGRARGRTSDVLVVGLD